MFKINTKKLVMLAIFMALGVVFKFFSIGNGEFRISFWDIPLFMAGIIAGPFYGTLCALGADLIYGLCFSPYPFSFIMMFTTLVWGAMGGFFYKKDMKIIALFIVVFITSISATAINSIYLTLYYGWESMLVKLPLRLIVLIVKWPITSGLIYYLYKYVFSRWVSSKE